MMRNPVDFTLGSVAHHGQVALVTGGARRVGKAIVQALAARGYAVAIHANNSLAAAREDAASFQAAGIPALAVTANLRDEGPVRAMVHRVVDHFGRLDAVVNSAAIWRQQPFESVTADDLRQHFEVNVVGSFVVAQEAAMTMIDQESGGCIISLGDWAVARPYANYAGYFPSKGAIPAMTRSLAVELAARNPRIRVNCVLPGPVMLPEHLSAEERHEAVAGTLLKREGRAEHVAHAVLFLIENEFVTGVCLPVDGGRTIA